METTNLKKNDDTEPTYNTDSIQYGNTEQHIRSYDGENNGRRLGFRQEKLVCTFGYGWLGLRRNSRGFSFRKDW